MFCWNENRTQNSCDNTICIFSASTFHNSGSQRKEKQQLYAATEGEEYNTNRNI